MTPPNDPVAVLPATPAADWLPARGEMSALIRAHDWSQTAAGPRSEWPQSLKMAVRIMLTSRFAMWMAWGPELTFFCNDAYSPTLGVKHPWALGKPADVVWAEIWPDIGPRVGAVLQTGEATWDEALLLFLERSGYREETYHTFSYSPLSRDDGQIGGMLCVVTEVTERVIGERRLRFLRDTSAVLASASTEEEVFTAVRECLGGGDRDLPFALIYLFDSEGSSARLAAAAGIAPGHAAAPTVLSTQDDDVLWPVGAILAGEGPLVLDGLAERLPDLPVGPWDRPAEQAVVVALARQGLEQPAGFLVAGINPYRKLDAEYVGFVGLFAGQLASALGNAHAYAEERRRADALAELDHAKTAFFSNVSHEFRTPLTLMLGPLAELLVEERIEPESRELIGTVHRNAQRLLKLVNTLLDFSRIEAGRVQAVYEATDLAAATAELASVFRAAVEKAGMRLEVDCPPLPEPVYVDRDMWEKIVLNLISNAFKYTFAGKIRVSLRAAGKAAVLEVRDTGTGIPPEELPNLFNRFHRIEGARGRTQEGSGIGLALVQELARLHGGSVTAESVLGEGSTFTVSLPLGREHLPAERIGGSRTLERTALGADSFVEEALRWLPDGTEQASETDAPTASLGAEFAPEPVHAPHAEAAYARPRVLLADDNADMRDYLRRLLARRYDVMAVTDGEAALAAARRLVPDLILTDVMMPRLDGFGLLRALREAPETAAVPVIMLSARAGEEARVEGLQAGADDYLVKPFSARELLARVSGTLALAKARREAVRREEELRAETTSVLESIGDGFVALDENFRFTYVNAAAERINGTPREELLGRDQWELYPATLGTPLETAYRRAMTERVPVHIESYYAPWDRWYEVNVYPTAPGGIAVYFRNITEQRRAMDALREADRRKDEFLATLAHELRNPLAPLVNGLEILRIATDRPEATARARRMMERQLQQMVRLIDDLLDLSRITRGMVELRRERLDLRTVVHSALETSRPLLDQGGHELKVPLPEAPVWVYGDPTRLSQVLANLLNNAAKYTERGGQIEVTLRTDGVEAELSVVDNGVGIEAAMLPHVFDMFSQVDRSLERTRGGLGIGLNIVQRLVEMHEGSVSVHSEGPGRGSQFVVRLPVLQANAPVPGAGAAEAPVAFPARRRVLVVDDNTDAAASLALMLEMSGHVVLTAHDGLEAVEAAGQFCPDVVLLDIGMPRLNGYDACRRIRSEPWGRHLTIVALTGWGQDEDRRHSREAGFDEHLVKPVAPEALKKVLDRLAASRSSPEG